MERNWEKELERLQRAVVYRKRALEKKAKEKGIVWERFGEREYRDLMDKFGLLLYTSEYDIRVRAWAIIDEFKKWCWDFTL